MKTLEANTCFEPSYHLPVLAGAQTRTGFLPILRTWPFHLAVSRRTTRCIFHHKVRRVHSSTPQIISSLMSLKILELSYPRLEKRVDEKSYYTQKTEPSTKPQNMWQLVEDHSLTSLKIHT
jgi:hypothetical protein